MNEERTMSDTGVTLSLSVGETQAQVAMDSDVWERMRDNPRAISLLLCRLEQIARIKGEGHYRLALAPEETH